MGGRRFPLAGCAARGAGMTERFLVGEAGRECGEGGAGERFWCADLAGEATDGGGEFARGQGPEIAGAEPELAEAERHHLVPGKGTVSRRTSRADEETAASDADDEDDAREPGKASAAATTAADEATAAVLVREALTAVPALA